VNPAGLVPIVVGILLIYLGVTGRYKQAWGIVVAQPKPPAPKGGNLVV
jgi:hypothetical protein